MQELIRPLIQLGLSPKEASVYVALLSLGSASAQAVSEKAEVNRVTTYAALEALTVRGLASVHAEGGKRVYVVSAPQQLEAALESAKAEVAGREHVLRGVMPMLTALFNTEGPKPHVRFLEGTEGRETVRRLFLGLKGEFVQMLSYDDVIEQPELHEGQADHLSRLRLHGARARVLLSMKNPDVSRIPVFPEAEIRLVPADLLPIHGEITVRGSLVFLYAYKPTVLSIVITSKEISNTLRGLFNLAWRGSEKISTTV